jgi:hypothetical protein
MFKSYNEIGFTGQDNADDKRSYIVRITDDDFVDDIDVFMETGIGFGASPEFAIIECYTKRGLPVAPNFIRHMLQVRDAENWPLDGQVLWNRTANPLWPQIEKDMQMYLLFS